MKNTNHFLSIYLLAILMVVFSCSQSSSNEEAQKLLQQQEALNNAESENIQGAKKGIENTLNEMVRLEDSLTSTQTLLATEKQKLQTGSTKLEVAKLQLQEERQKEALKKMQAQLDSTNQALAEAESKYNNALDASRALAKDKDSLANKNTVVANLDTEVRDKLITGIKEIDEKMEKLGKEKRMLEAQISLNGQKINVAEKKIEVLGSEKEVYEDLRNKLYADGASQSEVDAAEKMVKSIEENIAVEEKKIKSINHGTDGINDNIASINKQRASLSENIRKKYTTKEVMEEFMAQEKERLQKEMVNLDTMKKQKQLEAEEIALQKENLEKAAKELEEKNISGQVKELTALESQKMELEQELAALEKAEQDLAVNVATRSGNTIASELESEYSDRQAALDQEKMQLEAAQSELAAQQVANGAEQAEKKKNAMNILFYLLGAAVLLFGALYYLGKSKKSKEATS